MILETGQPNQVQQLLAYRLCFRQPPATHLQAEQHVLHHRAPGHERVALKHEPAIGTRPGHGLPVDAHLTLFGRQQPRNASNERGFAAATGADDTDEFAIRDRYRDVFENLANLAAAAIEIFGEPGHVELWSGHRTSCATLRQGATARSIHFKPSTMATPKNENISTPNSTVGVSKLWPAVPISQPSPAVDPNNSATTTPVSARPMPNRKPTTM